MDPEFRAGERVSEVRLVCTECGGKAEGNHSWMHGSGEMCDKCFADAEKEEIVGWEEIADLFNDSE